MRLIIILAISSLFMVSCNGNGKSPVHHDKAKALIEQQKQDSIREAKVKVEAERIKKEQEAKAKAATKWKYETTTDPLTDVVTRTATLESEEKNNIDGKLSPLRLFIYHNEGRNSTTVMIGLDQECALRQEMPLLNFRFDKGEIVTSSYIASSPFTAMVATYVNGELVAGKDWLKFLKESKTLSMKIELENGLTSTFTFKTQNFKWD